jgi:hypothetical protein
MRFCRRCFACPARCFPLWPHTLRLALDVCPLAPQRIHQHRLDDQPDIGRARVVQAELGALARVDRALEQRAEDRRLDLAPIEARSGGQVLDLVGGERQHIVIGKEPAIEARHARQPEVAARVEGLKQRPHPVGELLGRKDRRLQVLRHEVARQQTHVLREEGEDQLHEERRDPAGGKAAPLQQLGNGGEARGGLFGDALGALGGAQLLRIGEHEVQQIAGADRADIRVREPFDPRLEASEGDMDLEVFDIRRRKDRGVVQILFVEQQLLIRLASSRDVAAARLVLEGEAILPPHIGEAGLPTDLGQRLLEAVERAVGIGSQLGLFGRADDRDH